MKIFVFSCNVWRTIVMVLTVDVQYPDLPTWMKTCKGLYNNDKCRMCKDSNLQ